MSWEGTLQYFNTTWSAFSNFYADYYLGWVLAPILLMFIPFLVILIIYFDILIVIIYTLHWGHIKEAYETGLRNGALTFITSIWDAHSRIWHGYEVVGFDKIPNEGAALLIFYHGALPLDFYYILSKVYLEKSRGLATVADNFIFKTPGLSAAVNISRAEIHCVRFLASQLNMVPGTVQECVKKLNEGALLVILPGGVYEAQFGDSNYKLMWKNRLGFAKVALEAKCPVIPVFTQNIRAAFVSVPFARRLFLKLYSWSRLPLVPILGEFPVKLRTFIGDPIPYEPITPEELKIKVMKAIDEMILKHQRLPGSIFQGLLDRFRTHEKYE